MTLVSGKERSATRRGAGRQRSSPAQGLVRRGTFLRSMFPTYSVAQAQGAGSSTPVCAGVAAPTCSVARGSQTGATKASGPCPSLPGMAREGLGRPVTPEIFSQVFLLSWFSTPGFEAKSNGNRHG